MIAMLQAVLHYPVVRGAIAGIGSAAVVDVHSFLTWKKLDDAKAYDWGTAILRWAQGAVTGALAGAGLGAIS